MMISYLNHTARNRVRPRGVKSSYKNKKNAPESTRIEAMAIPISDSKLRKDRGDQNFDLAQMSRISA